MIRSPEIETMPSGELRKLQSERLTQQYAIAAAQGNTAAMQRILREQDTLAKYGAQLTSYQDLEFNFSKYHALCKQKMMDAKMDMISPQTVQFSLPLLSIAITSPGSTSSRKSPTVPLLTPHGT